jgi:hypothetical protein
VSYGQKPYDIWQRSRYCGGRPPETKFLQPSIWLRYNYYVQLVATKRNWMRVTNLNLAKKRGEAGRATGCSHTSPATSASRPRPHPCPRPRLRLVGPKLTPLLCIQEPTIIEPRGSWLISSITSFIIASHVDRSIYRALSIWAKYLIFAIQAQTSQTHVIF